MTSPDSTPDALGAAGALLDAIAAGDFRAIANALEEDVTMSALLPGGLSQWDGRNAICEAFESWFGSVDRYEVVDTSVGQLGRLLQLRWRLRLEGGGRFPDGPVIVEQQVNAATRPSGKISRISLLCTGFWPEDR